MDKIRIALALALMAYGTGLIAAGTVGAIRLRRGERRAMADAEVALWVNGRWEPVTLGEDALAAIERLHALADAEPA